MLTRTIYESSKSILIRMLPVLLVFSMLACKSKEQAEQKNASSSISRTEQFLMYEESSEDSLEMMESLDMQQNFLIRMQALGETQAVESESGEDAADDPAIWVNRKNPGKSLILGTNKTAGLYAYDLNGRILQFRKVGRINNVDLRDGFTYKNREVTIVAGSNRSNNSISIFTIDPETCELSDTIKNIRSGVDEVYGICLYHQPEENSFQVFVNGKGGRIEQWVLSGGESIEAKMVRTINFPSQPEGMVADDRNGMLYLGIEDKGIYKLPTDMKSSEEITLLNGSDSLNSNIAYDIEGLALFSYDSSEYLLASIQGNFSYAIFKLGEHAGYISSFIIEDGTTIDGAEETDGLEVSTAFFNEKYPQGLLVVQDGYNFDDGVLINQNFKLIPFGSLLKALPFK
ncbi:MAG: phytase [Bacteroidales bacterium]|nr:phytase [Bacteroidales bacterium]